MQIKQGSTELFYGAKFESMAYELGEDEENIVYEALNLYAQQPNLSREDKDTAQDMIHTIDCYYAP